MAAKHLLLIALLFLFSTLHFPSTAAGEERDGSHRGFFALFEDNYLRARKLPYNEAAAAMETLLTEGETLLRSLAGRGPALPYETLEKVMALEMNICARAAAEKRFTARALDFIYSARTQILDASKGWKLDNAAVLNVLYEVVYGGRLASEEMLTRTDGLLPPLIKLGEEVSSTPSAMIYGVKVHSGDILISRGGAAVSLLITRGSLRPGKFSRTGIVYVDEETGALWVLSATPDRGAAKVSFSEYLKNSDYGALLLRPGLNVSAVKEDPLLPHKAATFMFKKIEDASFAYDHKMEWKDDTKLYPEEMALAAYESVGIHLWARHEEVQPPGLLRWLQSLGVTGFSVLPASDLEYDRNLNPIFEWFNIEALHEERLTFAVLDALLKSAAMGAELRYPYDEVPLALLAKSWSIVDGYRGISPSVPDGISAFEALEMRSLSVKIVPLLVENLRANLHWMKERNEGELNYEELQAMAATALQNRRNALRYFIRTYEAEAPGHSR